jgi:anti-sigma regulatory factor (Ser/Thr protein kinase)
VLIESRFEESLNALGEPSAMVTDEVVPEREPTPSTNSYRSEYAWQFGYERTLLRRARNWVEAQRHELIGAKGLLSEALSNAYAHGNGKDARMPICVDLFVGSHGYLFRVTQSGEGFDVARLLEQYRRQAHYFQFAGNGLRRFDESRSFKVFFSPAGKSIHLWFDSQPR